MALSGAERGSINRIFPLLPVQKHGSFAGKAPFVPSVTGVDSAPLVSKPDYGAPLVTEERIASSDMQLYLDEITLKVNDKLLGNQVQLTGYLVADLPVATTAGGIIFVTDDTDRVLKIIDKE